TRRCALLQLAPDQVARPRLVGLDIGKRHGLVVLSGPSGLGVSSIGERWRQTGTPDRSRWTPAGQSRISRFRAMTATPSTASNAVCQIQRTSRRRDGPAAWNA